MRKKLGKYLKERRQEAGLSQKQVSDAFGYGSSQFISNIERGLCEPPIQIIKKMAKLYKISATELLEKVIESVSERLRDEFRKSNTSSPRPRASSKGKTA